MPRPPQTSIDRRPEDCLFARFRAGRDPDDLARVFDLTADRLLAAAHGLVRDATTADDAVQQTFLRALQHAERYEPDRPLMPWLQAILVNECRVIQRQRRRWVLEPHHEESSATDPAVLAARAEFRRQVERAIHGLPERYQAVLSQRLFHGSTTAQISRRLARPHSTVRIQLMRGLLMLRRALPAGLAGVFSLHQLRAAPASPVGLPSATVGRPALLACAGALACVVLVGAAAAPGAGDPLPSPRVRNDPVTALAAGAHPVARDPLPAAAHPAPRAGAGLRVHVRHHDGSPAAGAALRVRPLGLPNPYLHDRWLKADARGEVTLADPPRGAVELCVARGGCETVVTRPGRDAVTVTIPRGCDVEGVVVDADGAPVPGAAVWLSTCPSARFLHEVATAGADGRFELRDVAPDRYLGARSGGCATGGLTRIGVRGGMSARLVVRPAPGVVTGVVREPSGAPVAGAQVFVGTPGDPRMLPDEVGCLQPLWSAVPATTDAEGRYRVDGLRSGLTVVSARAPGYFGTALRVDLRSGAADVDLELSRARIAGRVVDAAGRPIAGARVGWTMVIDAWEATGVTTGADGSFDLTDGHAPWDELVVDGGEHGIARRRVRVQHGAAAWWSVVLTGHSRPLRGVLRGPDGSPLAGWTIDARAHRTRESPWRQRQVVTDAEGRFAFAPAADEPHTLNALPPGGRCPCGPGIVVEPGCAAVLQLASADMPTAGLRGRLRLPDGTVAGRTRISLSRAGWTLRTGVFADHVWIEPEPDGGFALQDAAPGEYDLTVYAPGRRPHTVRRIELTAGRTTEVGGVDMPHR